jgi:hypothetical protein
MMRVIHFFDFKPGVDHAAELGSFQKLEDYLLSRGCTERKTLKLLDANEAGAPAESTSYINESLWPGPEEAKKAFQELPEELQPIRKRFLESVIMGKTVRYVKIDT